MLNTFGQSNKLISIPKNINGDTSSWYKWQLKDDDELKLLHLILDTNAFHFRFWNDGQVIDIWSVDNKSFRGVITNYTYKIESNNNNKKRNKQDKILSNQVQIDSSVARQTYELIKTISLIPSDDSIKGWGQGEDGNTYIFETSTTNSYSFKTYWTQIGRAHV